MDKLLIKGRMPHNGEIYASGAKNSALPILASSLLSDSPLVVGNLPHLNDVTTMLELLGSMGVDVMLSDDMEVRVDSSSIKNLESHLDYWNDLDNFKEITDYIHGEKFTLVASPG